MRITKLILLGVLMASVAYGQDLKLGRYYSDQMVLQRDKANVIRGMAKPGAEVEVSFADQKKKGEANDKGVWEVTLDPMQANAKASDLTVKSGRAKAVAKDVLVGDVILFGRQTSIDITLGRDEEGKKTAASIKKNPNFRAITITMVPSPAPRSDLDEKATTGWMEVDKEKALQMSGAAAFLGRDLVGDVDVPVGIVDLNMGYHFPIAWLSRETLMIPVPGSGGVGGRVERYESQYRAFVEKKPWGKHKTVYEEDPRDLEFALYPYVGYNAVILPLSGVGFKGVIAQIGNDYPYMFYEKVKKAGGMSDRELMNQTYIQTYDIRKEGFRMEPAMITRITGDWRDALGDAELDIAFVCPPSSDLWPYAVHNVEMREIQRKVAAKEDATHIILPGMENIPFSGQPKDEALLAERSLKWAQGALYGKAASTGPVYDRHEGEGTTVTIHYKDGTAKGLKAGKGALGQFEVADVDAKYVPAEAVIKGQTVELTCDDLSRIFYIRYNYTEKPDQGLVNDAGLPAVPFRTEDAYHKWLVRYEDDDLPMEYSTPANEWKGGAVTLINAQLERIGYPHFSGWLGPIGVKTGPFGPNMGVREVKKGSPADGKLFVGDVIYSANGQMLGDEEEMTMAAAITKSEEKDGKLVLGVHRDGKNLDVELKLKVMGRYSATAPWDCLKTERIVKNLEERLVAKGAPTGFLYGDAMFLLGAGSPEHQWIVRRTATRFGGGGNNWALGYAAQYLSEYYLATGDKRVLGRLTELCDEIRKMQIREEGRRNGGWYGRGVNPRSYPAMAHTGVSAMLGLTLAKECGVDVDEETFQRGLAYLERKGAPVGQIIYGDAFRDKPQNIDPAKMIAGKLHTANGKIPEAAVLYELLGDRRSAYINSKISTHAWYSTYGGHGGHYWDQYWTPLGAAVHSKEAYMYFMKNHRWFRECNRMFDGSLITGGKGSIAAPGLALVVPRRRLRILGAPKSPFSPGAPEALKPALAAYEARDYKQVEALTQALLDDPKLDLDAAPTIKKLAEEANRMQEGIELDVAAIEELSREGRLYEAGMILEQLKPVIAEGDTRLAAASGVISSGKARMDDKALYEAAMRSGDGEDGEMAEAKSADDLKKLEEQKKAAAAAAAAAAHKWECLTPKEFVPDRKKKNPGPLERPAEEATKWKFTVLEHRDNAPEGWNRPGFDDGGWTETMYPLSWHLNHVTLHRAKFTVPDRKQYDLLKFTGWVFRQQDVAIYLNGNLIGRVNNIEKKTGTIENEFKPAAMQYLKDGENTIAIATRQNWRWGMLSMRVYNGGFDFMLSGRLAKKPSE